MFDVPARDIARTAVPTESAECLVAKAISEMTRSSVREVFVVSDDKNTLEGMLTVHSVLDFTVNPATSKVRAVMFPAPTVGPDELLDEVARKMLRAGVESIPMVEKGRLVGAVCMDDILERYEGGHTVEDVMTLSPITIEEHESIEMARAMMKNHRVNRLVVVDKGFKLVGVMEGRDLIAAFVHPHGRETVGERSGAKHRPSMDPVSALVPKEVHSVRKEQALAAAVELMLSRRIRALPVVNDKGEPIGLVTRRNILAKMLEAPAGRRALVSIKGIGEEDGFTVGVFKKIVSEYVPKLATFDPDLEKVHVQVKRLHDKKASVQYDVRVRAVAGLHVYAASADSWDLVAGASKAFRRLEREIKPRAERVRKTKKVAPRKTVTRARR